VSNCQRGFTLVELAVVLFILSLAAAILMPRLPGVAQSRKNAALRHLANSIQALYEDALFQKKSLALIYEIEENTYRAGEFDEGTQDYTGTTGLTVRPTRLPNELRFQDVETAEHNEGIATRGRALTMFVPQGYATPTWVHLQDDAGAQYTVVVHPLLGRAEILDGRVEKK
jgi:general secretion pathway protein H